MKPLKILVSAGEASGDLYASELVLALRRLAAGAGPEIAFFGCTGPRMRQARVRTVVDAANLAVVGLVEVIRHIPRIHGEFRKLVGAAKRERPALAILTDSPDFHLRLARRLKKLGIPVVYLVAPQVWAWRKGRIRAIRAYVDRLLCIFPFEKAFFEEEGVRADYIGHPLTEIVTPKLSKEEFFRKHGIEMGRPVVTALPGSRIGEIARHLPELAKAAHRLQQDFKATVLLATPMNFGEKAGDTFFKAFFQDRIGSASIQVIEGETWDAIAHADVVLAASGTVTVEAALLETPMVTFYKVAGLSWCMGRFLVKVPFYSMVNLIAGRKVVPELMQDEMTGEALAEAAGVLLRDPEARERMRRDLREVRTKLSARENPMERAARIVAELLGERFSEKESVHGS
jgi:lipid-A-disaccharide synthase